MAVVEVPQTLEYKGGQLNAAPVLEVENFTNWKKIFMCHIIDEQMNSVINCLTAKSTLDDLIIYHERPSDVKESRVIDLKLCYNTFKFKEGESLTQTFTRYKDLMNKLVNDGIKLSKLEINTGFINSIYETEKRKSLVPTTPLSTAFTTFIVHDFQDSPDDEEDIKRSHEYLNDLEEEYQARTILVKSKRPKDPVFIKSLADNSKMSITGSNKPKLSGAKDITLTNHDTIYSTQLPPLEKLTGAEPVSGPKIIKSILKLKSTFKGETFKGITINEASSAPVRGNKRSLTSKTNSAPAGKLKNVKIEDDLPLAIVMKEVNELKLQFSKNKSSYLKNKNSQQYHTSESESSSRSRPSRPIMPFPFFIHCGYNDHQSDDFVYYLICETRGRYDHDTHGHNRIISLRRRFKLRNPQHITKNVKHVVAMFIPHLITITLSGSEKKKLFKLRKLSLSKQARLNHQML
uniref:Retrovirus-related Pol polyprotein from transposon TNT 1-94 n=1 Tax=Tanacetum cinerariifolium TaxID=118510 RepID=A0A699HJW5_TANCI|nr:hypothetical protein [Tanacetum cinerariifolium]